MSKENKTLEFQKGGQDGANGSVRPIVTEADVTGREMEELVNLLTELAVKNPDRVKKFANTLANSSFAVHGRNYG